MQTHQHITEIDQTHRQGHIQDRRMGSNQRDHRKLGRPSIDQYTHQGHLQRRKIGRRYHTTSQANTDIAQSRR